MTDNIVKNQNLWAVHYRWTTQRWKFDEEMNELPDNYRCSLAIISKREPDDILVIDPPPGEEAFQRPILGVGISFEEEIVFIFNCHAPANDGLSKKYMACQIPKMKALAGGHPWICGGDFNLPPHEMEALLGPVVGSDGLKHRSERIVRTGNPTQSSGGEKDYFIVSGLTNDSLAFQAEKFGKKTGSSDHLPIVFSTNPADLGTIEINLEEERAKLRREAEKAKAERARLRKIAAARNLNARMALKKARAVKSTGTVVARPADTDAPGRVGKSTGPVERPVPGIQRRAFRPSGKGQKGRKQA